ncbi:MAG TPA: hypothetical protein VF679_07990 [Pedobacter sp.]|jgi:hypothetical protein
MRVIKTSLLLCVATLLVSCNLGVCVWDIGYKQINTKPDEKDLLGVFHLTEKSITHLSKQDVDLQYTKLELRGDHQYILVDAPSAIINQFDKQQTFIKAGKWSVSCEDLYGGCLIELAGICVVPLTKKAGVLSIPISIGDPDQCEGIVFERTGN